MASAETEYIDRFVEVRVWKEIQKVLREDMPILRSTLATFRRKQGHGRQCAASQEKEGQDTIGYCLLYHWLILGDCIIFDGRIFFIDGCSFFDCSTRKPDREPFSNLDNDLPAPSLDDYDSQNIDLTPSSPKPHNDELLPPPPKRSHRSRTTIEISDEENDEKPAKRSRHDRSTSGGSTSTSGGRRASRNAEAGNEIARGLRSIGEGMSAPLITKADTSHVDEVIELFSNDPTLLQDDPEGQYYALLLDVLGSNEKRARALVKTTNPIHRIALLKRIFAEQEVTVNWN
ncbi:hypothetical protein K438DRAFT_1782863 [Mycena galopus ATCC 62051]|nr:hypothetical protein K438DRAFT_1782863 [Mycena galopus ATCC 62051]